MPFWVMNMMRSPIWFPDMSVCSPIDVSAVMLERIEQYQQESYLRDLTFQNDASLRLSSQFTFAWLRQVLWPFPQAGGGLC